MFNSGVAELYGSTGVPIINFGVACFVKDLSAAKARDDVGGLQWVVRGKLDQLDYFGKDQGNGVVFRQYLQWLKHKSNHVHELASTSS